MEEEHNIKYSEGEERKEKKSNRGGRILRLEPTNTRELMASPMIVTCFKHVGCFEFCEKIQSVQHHPMFKRIFISNLDDN